VIFYYPQLAHVFLYLRNSSSNKWFNFKIPSWNVYTIIPFPTCSSTKYLKLSCSNFVMFWPKGKCLAYSLTNLSSFFIFFLIFFHNPSNAIWSTLTFNYRYPSIRVHTSHRPYGYPPFTLYSWQ